MLDDDFVAACVDIAVTANGRRRRNAMVRECVDDSGGGDLTSRAT